jgi:hypothetical protein
MLALLLTGCVAAVPIAVKYYQEKDFAKFEVQIQGNAADIYAKSVDSTKEANPTNLKVVKDDREELEFEGEVTKPSGRTYIAEWNVEQVDDKTSELRFLVKGMDGEEMVDEAEMKKIGTDGLNRFCARANLSCVIEQQ